MEEWKEYKVEDIISEISMGPFGSDVKKEVYTSFGVPILNGSNLQGFKLKEDSFGYVSEEKANSLKKCNAYRGDIVVTHRGTLGQIVYIPNNSKFDRYVISQSQFRFTCNNDIVRPDFLVYLFHTKEGQHKILSNASQVGVPALARATTTFRQIKVKIPSLSVQTKITNILFSLDDKIEVNRRINEQLEELAGALFKSWFVDFEPFKDGEFVESELGMIPKGWKVVEVGELCESISVKHKFDKDELIFLNTGDIHNNIYLHNNYMPINEMPGQAKKSIRKGDILYSEIRPINKHFAFVNFEANDYVVSTKLMVIRCRNINNLRLYQYLTSNEIIDFLQQEAETRSGTFPQIRFENIQRLKMIIASPIVEEQYDKNLLPIYNKIETNNKEIHHLTTLRDTLLPKLMSGEIDVNEVKI